MLSQLGSKSCERVSGNWQDNYRDDSIPVRERDLMSDVDTSCPQFFPHCLFEMWFKWGFDEKFHDVTDYILFVCQRNYYHWEKSSIWAIYYKMLN